VTKNDFTLYLEKHFANTGICAIFLAISSILLLTQVYFSKRKINLIFLLVVLVNLILIVYLKSRISIFLVIFYVISLFFKKIKFGGKIWRNIVLIVVASLFLSFLILYIKPASSEGRMLILKISTNLIKSNLLIGTGGFNTFPLHYPKYQADYFVSNVRSEQDIMLANNTKYALNEPIQLMSELGIIGFALTLLLLVRIFSLIRKENILLQFLAFSLLFVSCFYYVFHITLFQVISYLIILYVSSKDKTIFQLNISSSVIGCIIILLLCTKVLYFSQAQFIYSLEIEKRLSRRYSLIDRHNMLQTYFKDNPVFLTSYIYELYHKKKYTECWEILNLTDQIFIHSELENLKGKLFSQTEELKNAELCFIRACNICPHKFGYKYDLFKFYLKNNQTDLAMNIALIIHNLKEKIPSPTSMAIKLEIERFLNSQ
jgi:hypothetical protein